LKLRRKAQAKGDEFLLNDGLANLKF
jgi:hypothetical protein